MSWIATVNGDGDEDGCVWAPDVSALTIEEDEDGATLMAWAGDSSFAVGVFAVRQHAEQALAALAIHVAEEREGRMHEDVNVGDSLGGGGEPALLPLGPKSMEALNAIARAGGTVGMDYLAAFPAAVLAKLMPRYLHEIEGYTGKTIALTAEGKAMVQRYALSVVRPEQGTLADGG